MSVSKQGPMPAASAWELEFARLVAFPANPPIFMEQHWWQDLAGSEPADFVSIRKKHTREDRGSFQGVLLSLTVDLHRVVWLVQPGGELGEVPGKLSTLGPFREKVNWFVDLLSPWLASSCPPLWRLAFGGKMLQTAATHEEAYRILADHLRSVHFASNPNDFQLHINKRKPLDGLEINRVATWSKMNIAFSIEPGKPFTWPEQCYVALELDINTPPEKTDLLPRESSPRLFRKLADLGVEIAEYGDSPLWKP